MATYTWSVPTGKEITGTTFIKDTDNNISDTIDDLVEFVNGEGVHAGQGLTFDLVDKASIQTITGVKTFSSELVASGGVTGDVIGDVTGNSDSATTLTDLTSTVAELNILDGATLDVAELNILDGVTSTASELNILDGVTSTAAELNILDGATLDVTELNYVDGVTGGIQAQIDLKAPLSSPALIDVPTSPTALTTTNTTQIANTAFVQQEILASGWTYESGDIVVPTSSGKIQSAHGLGFTPTTFAIIQKCISVDDGYEVGDEILLATEINSAGRSSLWANDTYVGMSVSQPAQYTSRPNRETGVASTLTTTNWKLVFRAR